MTRYATRYIRAFARIHALHGSPTLDIIPPVSAWTLPAGVTYNAQYDQFVNASNVVQAVNYASWATETTVDFVPTRRKNDVALTIGGGLTTANVSRNAVIEWTSAIQTKVAAAWGVTIGSTLYRVKSWEVYPEGAAAPVEIRLELDKAE
jgi:hypothetical protein